ncbi:MAG TPA: hypothetical protein VIY29_17625 [Ktedonobacteraceae bacterium]
MFLVEKEIAFTGEKLFKGNTCQGRPMGIDPPVPVGSAIMPKTPIGSWAYLLNLPLLSRKKAVRHTFTAEQDEEEVVLLARVEAATGNKLEEHPSRQERLHQALDYQTPAQVYTSR